MEKCSNKKVTLPISTDIPSAYMLQPMGVLKSTEKTRDWYYENFINICCDNWKNGRLLNVGNGFLGFYCDVFDYTVLNYDDFPPEEIINKLKAQLNNGNYAFIYLDEYYTSARSAYMRYHFRHQSLIYGYDDNEQIFNAIAFDKTGHYGELKYSYDEVKEGYISGGIREDVSIIEPFSVVFFKIKQGFNHQLCLRNVIDSLQDYINGSFPKNYSYTHSNYSNNGKVIPQNQTTYGPFGLNAVRDIVDFISQFANGDLNYRHFINRVHFLYDHSKLILERIEYYQSKFSFDDNYKELIKEYNRIVNRYQAARMLFLKMDTAIKNPDKAAELQRHYFDKIAAILLNIIPYEKIILNKVVTYLKAQLYSNEFNKPILPFGKLNADTDYKLKFEKISDSKSIITINFDTPTQIKCISFANIADYVIKLDGENYDCLYFKDSAYANEYSCVNIAKSVSKIEIDATYVFKLNLDDVQINVYSDNIFLGKKATASSIWKNEDGSVNRRYAPDKVIDGSYNSQWRAKMQKNVYDGSDWLAIDIGHPQKLDTIIICQDNIQPRIKKAAISYVDEYKLTHNLLAADFKTEQTKVFTFPKITATSVKLKIIECHPDSNGYTEPIIVSFEGYCSH